MFQLLRSKNRYSETIFMAGLSIICLVFSLFRYVYTDTKVFLFLNWNLFLAFIPWALSSLLILKPKLSGSKFILAFVFCSWLLFFPNAPYILTDLYHLRLRSSMPVWFDLVLILSFAWTGLMFGFMSLWDIEILAGKFFNKKFIPVISSVLLIAGSFGIYIGRFLRWNSWDIISQPFNLMYDIADRVINPFEHMRTWGVTILMGLFLNILYWSFRILKTRNSTETISTKKAILLQK